MKQDKDITGTMETVKNCTTSGRWTEYWSTFEKTVPALRAGDGSEDVTPRIAFPSLHDLFSALTAKRLELMRFVASREGLNTHQLAQELDRNYKNVHTDVAALVELGLLEKDDRGALTAPFDEIVIHAGIRDAA